MRTRNVVHLNVRASLMAHSEAHPGASWVNADRDESPEDEDPSLWHD
jgi:hypothetical protein